MIRLIFDLITCYFVWSYYKHKSRYLHVEPEPEPFGDRAEDYATQNIDNPTNTNN